MSCHGFNGRNRYILCRIAPDRLDGLGFSLIIQMGGRTMCIDIVHIRSLHAGIIQSQLHALRLIFAVRSRARDMIGIRIGAVANQFSINVCAACFGMIQTLQNNQASSLTHDKTAARLVKGTGSMLRIIIMIHAERFHRTESGYCRLRNGCFRSACDHDVCIAALNHTKSVANAV